MRRPASADDHPPTHALRSAAGTRAGQGSATKTDVKLTAAELCLLGIQKAHDIPYPADIFAWRETNAAAIAALESQIQAEAGQ